MMKLIRFIAVFMHVLLHLIIFDELDHVRISTSLLGNQS
jgi:hypothetical protein